MVRNNSPATPSGSWRPTLLISLISAALVFSSLGISPARAADPVITDESWQELAQEAEAPLAELNSAVSDGYLELSIVRDINGEPSFSGMQVNSKAELSIALNQLNADPTVVAVDQVHMVKAFADPVSPAQQWALPAINAQSIDLATAGAGVKVAVIDTGVDPTNPDLSGGQILDGVDFFDGVSTFNNTTKVSSCISYHDASYPRWDGDSSVKPVHADFGKFDPNGHGTHVAGIIAASGIGIRGVTPAAKILPVRVLGQFGSGDTTDVACGIIWAVDNGAQVINMSLGSTGRDASVTAAVAYAISQKVTVVAASGNDGATGNQPNYPASEPGVIGVGAVSSNGNWASFSNYYPASVDVVAPGVGIISTCSAPYSSRYNAGTQKTETTDCANSDGMPNYESLSGTSMAAPHVAAVAAIILGGFPLLTPADVFDVLKSTSGEGAGIRISDYLGFGIVDAAAVIPGAITRSQAIAAAAEQTRIDAEKTAADKLAAEKAAADKAATDRLAAEQAAAAEAVRLASVPVVQASLSVKVLKKKQISISVAAPAGSKTTIQRKVGKKWKNVKTTITVPSSVIKVSRSGTYRVKIAIPSGTITTKSYKVK